MICPGCRRLVEGRLEVRTLDRAGDLLRCECGRRYPIIDGVPVVLADPASYFRNDAMTLVERDLPPEVAATLVESGPDEAPYARLLEHLSIYLDAHWGDRADPPEGFALGEVIDRLSGLAPVEHAAELGCSAGRLVAELAVTASHVVGLDLQFGTVRRARALLAGEPVAYGRRMIGRHYLPVRTHAGALATERVTLLCGDALDPPLLPEAYQRVVAINLLDSVSNPRLLLKVLDGMCERGGEVIVSSPYSWQSGVLPEAHRLAGEDPAITVRGLLAGGLPGRYEIVEDAELTWPLRRDGRSTLTYRIHYVRARKM